MKNLFSSIGCFFKTYIKPIILTGLAGMLIAVFTFAYKNTDLYRAVESLPGLELKIKYNTNHIAKEIKDSEKEAIDIAVGMRYNTETKKFFWRDRNKEYRPILNDEIGTFYRNEFDKKVYIKFEQ